MINILSYKSLQAGWLERRASPLVGIGNFSFLTSWWFWFPRNCKLPTILYFPEKGNFQFFLENIMYQYGIFFTRAVAPSFLKPVSKPAMNWVALLWMFKRIYVFFKVHSFGSIELTSLGSEWNIALSICYKSSSCFTSIFSLCLPRLPLGEKLLEVPEIGRRWSFATSVVVNGRNPELQ